jgi:glycosyltransferase involved in cell wall biosynthesis
VIAGNSGGAPEALATDTTGLVVSGEDAAELAAALTDLIENVGKRREFGRAARQRVLAGFTWDRAAKAVSSIHERLSTASRH